MSAQASSGWMWAVFGLSSTVFVVVSTFLAIGLEDRREGSRAVTIGAALAVGAAMSIMALVPVDIQLVSSTTDAASGAKLAWATPAVVEELRQTIETIYNLLFFTLAVVCFGLAPFAYLNIEESTGYSDTGSHGNRPFLYSSVSLGVLTTIMLIGAYYGLPPMLPGNLPWFNNLLKQTGFETGLSLTIVVLTLAGFVVCITHMGYGLTHTGLALIQSPDSYDGYKDLDVIGSLNNVRERLDMIRRRYPTRDSLRRMRPHERSQLEALEREEDFLQNQLYARRESSQDEDTHSLPLRAIEVVVGGVLLGVTAITIISILATLIDRGMHSCGTRCNFLVVSVGTITILDTVLYTAASLFPFDGLIVLLLTLYVIGCTFNILRKFGVGVFGLNLFTMGKETTLPQAIIIAAAMLCVCVPAWLLMLATAAPQYMSFGSQTICDAIDPMGRRNCTAVPTKLYSCQITSSPDICTPSVISTILSRYMYTLPAFGAIFHISMWIFCAVVIASLFLSCWQPPKSIYRNGERSSLVRNSETLEEV